MKLWAMLCRATQDRWLMVESSDKMWPTGEENETSRTPRTVWKNKKIGHWKMNLPGRLGAQYATGDQWRNNSRKNEGTEPKWKQQPVVDVTGDGSKVWCCKEQYCIGGWNVRSMNQYKLEVVKQKLARVNTDIVGISKLKCTGMDEFNSDDRYNYCHRQESLRRYGVALIVNKSPKCSTWMQSQKWQNDLCSFLRQTIQCHSNPSLCPDQ